jgi:hypothetical protein
VKHWKYKLTKKERLQALSALCGHGEGFISRELGGSLEDTRAGILGHAIEICEFYNAVLVFSPREHGRQGQPSGCYNRKYKEIRTDTFADTSEFVQTFCHELSHHFQFKIYGEFDRNSFREDLEFEREADEFSYQLYKWYFQNRIKIPREKFYPYSNTKNVKWLKKIHDE